MNNIQEPLIRFDGPEINTEKGFDKADDIRNAAKSAVNAEITVIPVAQDQSNNGPVEVHGEVA